MQSSELFRVLTCHISGDSCLLVDPKESMTFDFVRVAPNGQVTLVRKIKGLLMEKETGVITFSPDGSSRAFRWESDQMVEIASPASDEFITNIFGSFLLTRNLNGRMRLYRGRSLLFEHQGSMWISGLSANGEAYVGLMQQTGYRSFLSTDKPTQELGTLIRSSERNDLQAEESGALIGGSLWIQ